MSCLGLLHCDAVHHSSCQGLLQETFLFAFAHAFAEDLLLLQPALEAVKERLQVPNAFRLLLDDQLKFLHICVYEGARLVNLQLNAIKISSQHFDHGCGNFQMLLKGMLTTVATKERLRVIRHTDLGVPPTCI